MGDALEDLGHDEEAIPFFHGLKREPDVDSEELCNTQSHKVEGVPCEKWLLFEKFSDKPAVIRRISPIRWLIRSKNQC